MQRPYQPVQNRLLAALPAEDYGLLAPHLIQIDLDRGRILYEPGDRIDMVYFPHDGVISMMTLMENGAAIENAIIGRESALGLMAAAGPRQSLSRAIVQPPCRCARISAHYLQDAWTRSPAVRRLADQNTEALLAQVTQLAACNALHSVESRFCRWLLSCHDRISTDTVALTQEYLADMLGVQRTTVTTVARALQEKGVIRYRRGVVDIVNRAGLEATSCECHGVVKGAYERLLPAPNPPARAHFG
jgi:CRP-like cAMP-binding protein